MAGSYSTSSNGPAGSRRWGYSMPTITVVETFPERGATLNQHGDRTHVRSWHVYTDTDTLDAIDVGNALPVDRGDHYVGPGGQIDLGATVRDIEVRQKPESPRHWFCTAKYSSEPLSSGASGGSGNASGGGKSDLPDQSQQENPLLRPAELRYGHQKQMRVAYQTVGGTPIVNSAGFPFDPPVEVERVYLTLQLGQNIADADFDPQIITTFVGKTNSAQWGPWAIGKARCSAIVVDRHFENGIYY